MQWPETPAEILVLIKRHLLIAEEDNLMLDQCIVNLLKHLVAERFREVRAGNLGTDVRADGVYVNRLIVAHAK